MFICESWMSQISDYLGLPVNTVRERNFYRENGDKTHFNQKLIDFPIPRMFKQLKEETKYEELEKQVAEFNSANRWKKRGLSLIPTKYGIAFSALFLNQVHLVIIGGWCTHPHLSGWIYSSHAWRSRNGTRGPYKNGSNSS